jgi:hypothetical protein
MQQPRNYADPEKTIYLLPVGSSLASSTAICRGTRASAFMYSAR